MKSAQKRAILGAIVGTGLAAGIFGCPASFPDVGPFGPSDDGGNDADGQIVPPGCDLTKDPSESAPCVDDSIGLFVSGNGSDSNAGTKLSPLKTITAALAKVTSQHNRVYVCDGTYGEGVKITVPVGIYGGFTCTDWSYDKTQGKVGPTGVGYALDIEGVSGGSVTIEDLEFDAQPAVNPGDSSIAIFAANSTVTLKRVKAIAGNGATGADAVATSNYPEDAGTAPTGNSADAAAGLGDMGGATCVNHCADGTVSMGGAGGTGQNTGAPSGAGADGGPTIPQKPLGADGIGGNGKLSGCNTGDTGATADAADAGAVGATLSGHVSNSGWAPATGSSGTTGGPGQGGGGGSGGTHSIGVSTGGGGGGGCGGCGGGGGAGGQSGGSSFAIVAYQTTLVLDACILQVGNGGDGRVGGAGQVGQAGGIAGASIPLGSGGTGCNGATGGAGGDGAGGGGGAGGNSIAIGYVGTKPTVTGGTMTEGTAGNPGAGGTGVAGNNGLAGAAGTKADVQELP